MILIVLYMPEGIMGRLGDKSGTSLQRIWKWVGRGDSDEAEVREPEEVG